MNLRLRILLALIVLACFIAGMFITERILLPVITPAGQAPVPGVLLDQVFTKADFRYGPQATRPYYDPLAIDPSANASAGDSWYMMYIDLNGTPVSGNPEVRRTGSLKVTYNFSALAGKAVFHVYGSRSDTSLSRTNRQEGYNRCGWVVQGSANAGRTMPATAPLSPSGPHEYTLTVANVHSGDSNDFAAAARTLQFERAGSGLDALHITQSLATPKGQVTETPAQQGSFFVTSTGGNPGTGLLLLVAVNRMQPEEFSLKVTSEFVGAL